MDQNFCRLSWAQIADLKYNASVEFIEFLFNNNYITNTPVQKQTIYNLYKKFKPYGNLKPYFFELLGFFLYVRLIKDLKHTENKDYIHFRPQTLNTFLPLTAPKTNTEKPTQVKKATNKNNINNKTILKVKQNLNQSNASQNSSQSQNTPRKTKKRQFVSQNVAIPSPKKETKYITNEKCEYCNCKFNNNNEYEEHIKKEPHILRQSYRTDKKSLLNESEDILQFETKKDKVKLTEIQSNIKTQNNIQYIITNKNENIEYHITDLILLYTQLKELNLGYKLPIVLKPKNCCTISIKFTFQYEGNYILPIIFKVENKTNTVEPPKYILKELVFSIQSDLVNDLKPKAPYKKNTAVSYIEDLPIIDGVLPPSCSSKGLTPVVLLGHYKLPPEMTKLINYGLKMSPRMSLQEQEKLVELRKLLTVPDRQNSLTAANYCKMLTTLLQFEEHQMWKDIREYDCDDQIMRKVPSKHEGTKLLTLEVPGLAENRPSLIRGDDLLVKIPGDRCYYKGYIHRVNETTIELGFYQKFVVDYHFDAQKYSVKFGFNRHTLRTEHQAVEMIRKHNVGQYFFPKKTPIPKQLTSVQFVWYQTQIKNNPEQQQAVKHIVSGTSFPYPYLLFGPPGTGKTMTMVEAILQLWTQKPKSKILVAAPSNSAANEVTSRLLKYIKSKTDIFRMISVSFSFDKVPDDIKPYCNNNGGEYFYPPIEILESYRIVIVTLTAAAKFVYGGVTPGRFSHIFIDESGHSTESEVLIPIGGIISAQEQSGRLLGQVILAGDPEQLGPIIHSKLAKSFGFETSMLERLMKTCDVYQKKDNKYNPNMVTKLLKNFRSHESILKLPDEMFYDKELIPEGNPLVDIAIGWEELPNTKFPLIFHNVQGKDEREERSPSYFNRQEIDVVVNTYLNNLVGRRLQGKIIQQSDIGVVSPYRKQVQKLQQACKKKNWNDILIGSVEQFQGQERLIIIISTVRSKLELVEHDYKFHLGFLRNPKRFNVAITRAKALVVVIGNPNILMWDEHWGKFIEYCCNNNALAGPSFEFKPLWYQSDHTYNNELQNLSIDENNVNNGTREHADFSRGNM